MDNEKLGSILQKVNLIQSFAKNITKEELTEALDYLNKMEAIGPMIDPTTYMALPAGSIGKLKTGVRALIELKKTECSAKK